jgi:hypothetical protein
MFKKLLFLLILTLTFFIQFNNNVEALVITELQTFNVGFTPVKEFNSDPDDPDDPLLNIEGTFAMLVSSCITIPENALTLTVQPTTQFRDIFGIVYKSDDPDNDFFTEIRYFENLDCTSELKNNITDTNEVFFVNNPDGVLASKTYVFDLDVPFKGFDIDNPIGIKAFKMVYATRIPFANIVPFYYTSGTNASAELININVGTRFSFETPNRVDFVNNGTVISKYFMNRLPQQPTPTKTFHTFLYYADIEANRVYNRGYYNPELLQNRVLTLTAVFEKDFTTGQPTTAWIPPAVNNPIGTILFNLGYYNITGFVFLYTLLILISSVALWYYGMNSFVTLISNILITAVFMFFGYLPFFVSIIMIMLFFLLIIGINKGGLFSE